MAYVSQELKKSKAPLIKQICLKYGVKTTLGVDNHSTLVLRVSSGSIDFISNYNENLVKNLNNYRYGTPELEKSYIQVNDYHYKSQYTGKALDFLAEIMPVLNEGNFNHSDSMTDYFHVGWYVDVKIGQYDKPYIFNRVTGLKAA